MPFLDTTMNNNTPQPLSEEQQTLLREKMTTIDTFIQTFGHPAVHPLHGLDLLQTTPESIEQLKPLLKTFQEQLYQYTALLLFAADKEELAVPAITWLPNWTPTPELVTEPIYQNILKPIVFNWKLVENEGFLFKYFAKKKYLKKWEEGCAAHIQNLENTYTAISEIAHLEMPETDTVTEFPRNITRWNVYLNTRAKDWCQWCQYKQELEAMQLSAVVYHLISQQQSGAATLAAFA